MGVELHIEELVLRGFAARDRHRIAAAVQSELTRLLSAEGKQSALANPVGIAKLNGGAFEMKPGSKRQEAGTQIARAVFRSLSNHAGASAAATGTRSRQKGGKP
jgi:hypothetical protein